MSVYKLFGVEDPEQPSESHGMKCRKGTLQEIEKDDIGVIVRRDNLLVIFAENDRRTINITDALLIDLDMDPFSKNGDEWTIIVGMAKYLSEVHVV